MRISDWSSDVCSSDLVEIVEIGNAGQHGYGYFNGAFHACVRFFQCHAILGGQLPHRSQPGNNAKTLPSGKRLNGGIALIKKLNIAPEFIDKKGLYHEIGRSSCWDRVCQKV